MTACTVASQSAIPERPLPPAADQAAARTRRRSAPVPTPLTSLEGRADVTGVGSFGRQMLELLWKSGLCIGEKLG